MKTFCNISPILFLIIVILGFLIISIFTNEVNQNSLAGSPINFSSSTKDISNSNIYIISHIQ